MEKERERERAGVKGLREKASEKTPCYPLPYMLSYITPNSQAWKSKMMDIKRQQEEQEIKKYSFKPNIQPSSATNRQKKSGRTKSFTNISFNR